MGNYYNDIPVDTGEVLGEMVFGGVLAVFGIILFILLIIVIFSFVYNYIIFKKAGRKGWEAFIPVYNTIVKFEFLDIPMWMIILLFIPAANVAVNIITSINMAKKFNKDTLFAIGLIFVPIVFYPILAFGSSEFHPEIRGLFNESNKSSNTSNMGYCTNCGSKLEGLYCSDCGKKKED